MDYALYLLSMGILLTYTFVWNMLGEPALIPAGSQFPLHGSIAPARAEAPARFSRAAAS